jgi:hypothetical protein
MDPTEEFYAGSLHRAYENRASPDEIVDATRLAVLVGRVTPEKAIQYAEDLFALDCNTFVGNYLGVSPSTAIFAYVNGYGTKAPSGATPDVLKSMALVKCPPRSDPEKIAAEDIIVSYDPAKKEWSHIALVNGIKLDKPGKNGEITATVDICEWGTAGDLSRHHNTAKPTLTVGKGPVSSTVDVVGWKTDKGGMRYFLDGSAFASVPARGWGILSDAKGTIAYDV